MIVPVCCSEVRVRQELFPDGVRPGIPRLRAEEAAAATVHRGADRQERNVGDVPTQHHRRHRQVDGQGTDERGALLVLVRQQPGRRHHHRLRLQGEHLYLLLYISSFGELIEF